jgi:uncharacterized membrane protein
MAHNDKVTAEHDAKIPPINLPSSPDLNAVWTYRGYRMDNRDFTAAMVHLYRGEITRANAWRGRLDVTTNWALISTGAAITFAFSDTAAHHSVILLNLILVTLFLCIEARRYRYFELWSYRIRSMEINFYGALLVPPFQPSPDWAQNLAQSLLHPAFPITFWEAFGRRLRRNYVWIYLVLQLAWVAKILLTVSGNLSWEAFVRRAGMGLIPGWAVLIALLILDVVVVGIAIATFQLHAAPGEVLPSHQVQAAEKKSSE